MVSFAELWEQIDKEKARKSPLMSSEEDNRALIVVRTGKEMHEEGKTSFWEEFSSLCNNAEGMSQLLGVPTDKIRSWPAKIEEALDKLERQTAVSPSEKIKTELMPTGDNGAFTTNQDPTNIGDAY